MLQSQSKQHPCHQGTASETIFACGDSHFSSLISDINRSNHTIDLESYGFSKDKLGDRVVDALLAALKRGVSVRILVDGFGAPFWGSQYAKRLEAAGAETRIFHPLAWQHHNWRRSCMRLPWLWKPFQLLLKSNARNHRKICMIDGRIAYVGSFNIRQVHLSTDAGGASWRDTSIRLENVDITEMNEAFDSAWFHKKLRERIRDLFHHIRKEPRIRLNHTRHRRRILYKHFLRKINLCKQRLWITNAYFVPDNKLLKRLKDAAKRGCDVRILLPKKSDIFVMPWASQTFYRSLIKSGVRIFEYLPSVLHAKSLILDDWMLIGSSNLNSRSMRHDLEVDVNVMHTGSKKALVKIFLNDLQQAKEVSLKTWEKQRQWYKRLLGQAILYIKYWI